MFWDRVAAFYDVVMKWKNGSGNRALCGYIASCIQPGDLVLECACGTGIITEAIAPLCQSLVATDYSEGMLKQTRKKCLKYGNVRVEQCNILQLSYGDKSFDKVVAGNVIHLLDEPGVALNELLRVCKPGGTVILPTYVNKQKNGKDSLFVRLLARFGAGFRRQFSYEEYQAFIRQLVKEQSEFALIDGAMPCALALIHKTGY